MPEAPSNDDSESPQRRQPADAQHSPPTHAITKAHRPIAAQLNHRGYYASESRKDKAEWFDTLSKDKAVSPKGPLAFKQKLLPHFDHVHTEDEIGLEFDSGGPALGDNEAFASDNYGRGLAYTNVKEGMSQGVVILSKMSDSNGRNKWAGKFPAKEYNSVFS